MIFIAIAVLGSLSLEAQNQQFKKLTILQGETFVDTIYSFFQPVYIADNLLVSLQSIGNRYYRIEFSAPSTNPNYVGSSFVSFQYTSAPPIKPYYMQFDIEFVISEVNAYDDFVSFTSENSITVSPTSNDMHTDSVLHVHGISKVENGTVSLSGDIISFTPTPGQTYGKVLYSIMDGKGTSGAAIIHFIKSESGFAQGDTLAYTMLNTRKQFVFLPAAGFNLTQQPTKGAVVQLHNQVYQYTPNEYASGSDFFTLTDALGNFRRVELKIIPKNVNRSSVRDDVFYTAINTPITFNVLANDLSSNFPIVQYSSELVPGSTAGTYTYTPPQYFTGTKNLFYKVNYGNYQYTGKVAVHVGNIEPQEDRDYTFSVYNYENLVLTYDVPVNDYHFEIADAPFGADAAYVLTDSLVTDSCASYYSKAHIVYDPSEAFYGMDSFSVRYVLAGSERIIKIYVNVVQGAPDGECHCTGPDCIWGGDLNGDGVVSVNDVLALGRFMGLGGKDRDDITYPFRAGQSGDDWFYAQPNGKNTKHIDSDGDGLISISDTLAISQAYGSVSRLIPEEILAIKDYPFELRPNAEVVDSGDLLELEILLGNETESIQDIFGLAFGLNVNPTVIDSSSLRAEFYSEDNWFSQYAQTISMVKQPKEGKIHVGYTRALGIVEDEVEGIKPRGASGSGAIGKVMFIVEDEVEGIRTDGSQMTYRVNTENIIAEDADGNRFKLPDTYADFSVRFRKAAPVPTAEKLLVFPNPATDMMQLHFNGRNLMESLVLFDQMGRSVLQKKLFGTQRADLDISSLENGLYHLQVYTPQGVVVKKVMIVRAN